MKRSISTESAYNSGTMFCFMIQGENICKAYAHVLASDVNAARARMAPLFRGCELIAVDDMTIAERMH